MPLPRAAFREPADRCVAVVPGFRRHGYYIVRAQQAGLALGEELIGRSIRRTREKRDHVGHAYRRRCRCTTIVSAKADHFYLLPRKRIKTAVAISLNDFLEKRRPANTPAI
jgi:hypothetical protein